MTAPVLRTAELVATCQADAAPHVLACVVYLGQSGSSTSFLLVAYLQMNRELQKNIRIVAFCSGAAEGGPEREVVGERLVSLNEEERRAGG